MLDRGADDPAPRGPQIRHPSNREVVRLGATAGEHDFACTGADETRNLGARPFQSATGALAAAMDGSGIGILRFAEAGDAGAYLGPQWRAGVVVKINAHMGLIGPRRTINLP